jgi:N-acetylmuramoyl-L-alanine amidase
MRLAKFALIAVAMLLTHGPLVATPAEYVLLRTIAERHGASLREENGGREATLIGRNFSVKCTLDKSSYLVNGVCVYGQGPTGHSSHGLTIPLHDWKHVLSPLIDAPKVPPVRRICIDAGHGGNDSGAHSATLNLVEKSLNLDMALRLRKLLQAKGFKVFLTRDSDRFVPLEKRPAMANEWATDLFVSIHFNGSESPSANGAETYVVPKQGMPATARLSQPKLQDRVSYPNNQFDDYNLLLAYAIEKNLSQLEHVRDRGVKRGRFCVLELSRCPAVLVECGFISSPIDGPIIAEANHRQALAAAICEGISDYAFRGR